MNWNVGLDIGTSGARMAIKGHGVQFKQSAAIAECSGETLCAGNDAALLLGRTPGHVRVGFPMRGAAVADEMALRRWYQYLLKHAASKALVRRPRVLLACPPGIQPTPLKHLVALCMEAGATACSVVRSDVAAALGSPIDVSRPQATLVCDLGAGHLSASLISGGRVVAMSELPYGMQRIDEAIIRRLRKLHAMAVGPRTAEDIKLSLVGASGASAPSTKVLAMSMDGGFPREFDISAKEVQDAAQPTFMAITELIYQVLQSAPAELSADLHESGVVLTGGGAQLFGLPLLIAQELGLQCHLPKDPPGCVAEGLLRILESDGQYDHLTQAHTSILDKR